MTKEEAIEKAQGLATDFIAFCNTIIEALEQKPKTSWIPVKDNMPVIGEEVLVCDLDGNIYITYLHTDSKWRWGFDYGGNKIKNVIAWMPLPEIYKAESEEK